MAGASGSTLSFSGFFIPSASMRSVRTARPIGSLPFANSVLCSCFELYRFRDTLSLQSRVGSGGPRAPALNPPSILANGGGPGPIRSVAVRHDLWSHRSAWPGHLYTFEDKARLSHLVLRAPLKRRSATRRIGVSSGPSCRELRPSEVCRESRRDFTGSYAHRECGLLWAGCGFYWVLARTTESFRISSL